MPLPFNLPWRLPSTNLQALGTMIAKDPYCEVYKVVFACAEAHAGVILRSRAAPILALRRRYQPVLREQKEYCSGG
jgi:hypothetical protein